MKPEITLIKQHARNGRYIGMVTRVTFPDGRQVTFMERLPKGLAIQQAQQLLAREETR